MEKVDKRLEKEITKLKGPILIFGAGGFIGVNLLKTILQMRKDVFGISRDGKHNWRLHRLQIPLKNILNTDITDVTNVHKLLTKIKPKTIFNLAAYGAYAKQSDYKKIYDTNVLSTITLLEFLKNQNIAAYIHAGSQSEYGVNASGPKESDELIPNSHYAVSKIADYFVLKYYGKIEEMPVTHLRLYSVYGPWEEPDRLIPTLIAKARYGNLPNFVDSAISRDFVYIDDVIRSCIFFASRMKPHLYGEVFNICTGRETTIRQLAFLTKKLLHVSKKPVFGTMENRKWDIKKWYGNNAKMKKYLKWAPSIALTEGLKKTIMWQKEIQYNPSLWNLSGES